MKNLEFIFEYQPIAKKDVEGDDDDSYDGLKENESSNINDNILKEETNGLTDLFNKSLKYKNQDPKITNKRGFISTLRPNTKYESEYFKAELLEHHVIIFGVNPNIKHLITPLRTRNRTRHFLILIIDKN